MSNLQEFLAIGPIEGMRVTIPVRDIRHQRRVQVALAVEDAAADGLAGDEREPAFDLVEPGRVRRRGMEVEARMLKEPVLHLRREVVRGVVEDAMHVTALVVPGALLEQLDELEARLLLLHVGQNTSVLGPAFTGTVRLSPGRKLLWEAGYFWALDDESPDRVARLNLEYEF